MGRRTLQLVLSAIVIAAGAGCAGLGPPEDFVHFSIVSTLGLPAGFMGSGIAVEGSLAYISLEAIGSQKGTRSLAIVSVETPAAPTLVSTSSGLTSDMAGIVVSGNYAYVPYESATGTNFQVWDVSNPSSPAIVGSTSIPCPAGMYPFNAPALYGNYVYVACWESEVTNTGAFAIVDVTNPASPVVARSVSVTTGYQPISFAIWQQNLYVVATQGGSTSDYVLLYSIADPISPELMASQSVPHSPQWVAALGTAALAPIYDGTELEVIDFANPSSPLATSANLGSCRPMSVTVYPPSLALVPCDQAGGLAEVNVATTARPSYLGTALSGTVLNDIVVSGNTLYGVDAGGNFEVMAP